jgi:hypothetical protein
MSKVEFNVNDLCNWRHDPDTRLTYLGRNWSGNGYWHQFALVDDAERKVWCEIRDADLSMIERTQIQEPTP